MFINTGRMVRVAPPKYRTVPDSVGNPHASFSLKAMRKPTATKRHEARHESCVGTSFTGMAWYYTVPHGGLHGTVLHSMVPCGPTAKSAEQVRIIFVGKGTCMPITKLIDTHRYEVVGAYTRRPQFSTDRGVAWTS